MASAKISGAEHAIQKIFSNDFAYTIPKYQRPYSWTTTEADELFNDLIGFLSEGAVPVAEANPYFLGSIVLIKGDEPDADVVDGQQRLTTLTILLSALRASVSDSVEKELTIYLYEKGSLLTGTQNRYRLSLRPRDKDFFKEYVQDEGGLAKLAALGKGTGLSDSQRNLRDNALLFMERLKSLPVPERERLASFIITRCYLVVVSTPDFDSAYRIFSVLNSRGQDLSFTDILKADIIGNIKPEAKQDYYTVKWEDTEELLGREGFRSLFTHLRTIYRKIKPKETILKEIRQYIKPADQPETFVQETLLPYADAYMCVSQAAYTAASSHTNEINRYLKWLNKIDNFDWMPPALAYMKKNANQLALLGTFFKHLETLAAGLMICRTNVNYRIERYAQLLLSIESDDQSLMASGSPLFLTTSEKAKVTQILNGDLYEEKTRLYVLLRLDEQLSGAGATYNYNIVSIEHVLPQSPQTGSVWLQNFPSDALREQYTHRLGNLVLLSRSKNSAAQNYEFATKKQKYFTGQQGISPFALTTQVLQEANWTPTVIDARQTSLMNHLKTMWSL